VSQTLRLREDTIGPGYPNPPQQGPFLVVGAPTALSDDSLDTYIQMTGVRSYIKAELEPATVPAEQVTQVLLHTTFACGPDTLVNHHYVSVEFWESAGVQGSGYAHFDYTDEPRGFPTIVIPNSSAVYSATYVIEPDDAPLNASTTWAEFLNLLSGTPAVVLTPDLHSFADKNTTWWYEFWVTLVTPSGGQPPRRIFPRDDGMTGGARRTWPPSKSQQWGNRVDGSGYV
jgi:hypothetical protein